MPINGKLRIGDVLDDWQAPRCYVTEVVSIASGPLPTPIDLTVPRGGSSAERCVLFGGTSGSRHAIKPSTKGQP